MTTLTQGSHSQLKARQSIQQAAAIVAGCFPASGGPFLTHCTVGQVRAANLENHSQVREL